MPPKKYETKIGDKFERLTVIGEIIRKGRYRHVPCRCNCGKITTPRIDELFSGNTKSCGCLGAEARVRAHFKHGHKGKRIYQTWINMKRRCVNKKDSNYENYGGRGITICDEWLEFMPFYEWAMSHGYQDNLTIERIRNNCGYLPSNCRWATRQEQTYNHRVHKNSKTGHRGVCWAKKNKKYVARIGTNRTILHLGYFIDIKDAIIARKAAELKYWQGEAKY